MDSQLLHAFTAVARHRSFTRAAEDLGTTQPLLSRAMQRLEDIVGEPLFDRSRRRIALTPSGAALLAEAPAILDHIGLAIRRAQIAGHGAGGTLRVGYGSTMWEHMAYRGVRKFRADHPDILLDFRLLRTGEQVEGLRTGEIDVAMMSVTNYDRRDLAWRIIGREPYVVALPSDWPIDRRGPVDLARYRDRPFMVPDPDLAPEAHAASIACCVAAGFQPQVAHYIRDGAEMRFLVASGLGAGFAYGSALQTEFEGVRFAPIAHVPPEAIVEIHMIWADRALPPILRRFVDCMLSETYVTDIVTDPDRFRLVRRHVPSEELRSSGLIGFATGR